MYNKSMSEDNNPLNRRALFKEGFSFLGKVVGEFVESTHIEDGQSEPEGNPLDAERGPLRPPGAVSEQYFNSFCDKCDECVIACPEMTLIVAPPEYGLSMGTPVFEPERKACFLCPELYCIKACPTPALVMPDRLEDISMGVARINSAKCRAFEGEECDFCVEFCPMEKKPISIINGRPFISAQDCVGCGQCEYHCLQDAGRRAITTLAPPKQ